MADSSSTTVAFTLESVRDELIRHEDSIVYSIIERAKYPRNSKAYDPSYLSGTGVDGGVSLVELFVRESETVHAKAGRYQNPEEVPFFPQHLPAPVVPTHNYSMALHPAAAPVDISKNIWDVYFGKLLPFFTVEGDDGNYASTVACDLVCLQALSQRIHYGKFVAEVKFKDAPQDYSMHIRKQDRDALMNLLTFVRVEEEVKKRVEKKGMTFGENIFLDNGCKTNKEEEKKARYKVDPSVFSHLYGEWVMPLTKLVQVEYLLHRLD